MYAKLTATKFAFSDWICTAFHQHWWKAEWITGEPRISVKCERCGLKWTPDVGPWIAGVKV